MRMSDAPIDRQPDPAPEKPCAKRIPGEGDVAVRWCTLPALHEGDCVGSEPRVLPAVVRKHTPKRPS